LNDKPSHFLTAHQGQLENSTYRGQYPVAGQGAGADYSLVSENDARLGRAYYYNLVRLIDQQVGRIIDALDRSGLLENTFIVFLTDHGELLGDHGLWMKGPFHYEELVRIPLIISWPAGLPQGKRVQDLASQVDLVPTLLDAAGVDQPAGLDGISLLPTIRADQSPARDAVFIECVDDPGRLRLKTIITRGRKLTYYHGQSFGELYDLDQDPHEIINRWDDPLYSAEKHRLIARILDHLEPLEPRARRYCYA
jgi:arylsulfatase A-like enzyme